MQPKKTSFKIFTSRELMNFQRLYQSREFASVITSNISSDIVSQINNTYFIYGTMNTLSSMKRMGFRNQLIKINTLNNQHITFTLFPKLVSQSVIKFSQLSKLRFYLKGTSYLIKITFIIPIENSNNFNQINFIINKFQDYKFDNNEKINFIPSFILLPTIIGSRTPRLYTNVESSLIQNKESLQKLISLQIFYLINVIYSIFIIIKLSLFVE